MQAFCCEVARALMKLGMAIAANRPMMATTIIISTRVKPALREVLFVFMFYSLVSFRGVNDATGGFHLLLQSSFTDCLLQPQLWSSLSMPGAKVQQVESIAFLSRPLLLNGREFEADTMLVGLQCHLKCPILGHHVEFSDTPAKERISANRVSRGEQSRRSCVVSKAGIILVAPPLLEEGERSEVRRKEGWRGQDRRLCCAS